MRIFGSDNLVAFWVLTRPRKINIHNQFDPDNAEIDPTVLDNKPNAFSRSMATLAWVIAQIF